MSIDSSDSPGFYIEAENIHVDVLEEMTEQEIISFLAPRAFVEPDDYEFEEDTYEFLIRTNDQQINMIHLLVDEDYYSIVHLHSQLHPERELGEKFIPLYFVALAENGCSPIQGDAFFDTLNDAHSQEHDIGNKGISALMTKWIDNCRE